MVPVLIGNSINVFCLHIDREFRMTIFRINEYFRMFELAVQSNTFSYMKKTNRYINLYICINLIVESTIQLFTEIFKQ